MIGLYYKDEDGNPDRTVGIIIDVNEERERSFMLNTLLNEIPGGVAVFKFTDKFECQFFSDGFAKMSGRTRAEIEELLQANRLFRDVVAPSDYENLLKLVKESISGGLPINATYRYAIKGGTIGWLHLTATKLRKEDGYPVYYCIFTNPTSETSIYRSIVEDSSIGVFVAERQSRRVLYINDAIRKLFELPREIIDKRINNAENISTKFNFFTQEDVDSLKADSYKEFHVVWQDKLYLCINAKALTWNGVDSYIMYFIDETSEHEHQVQLQKLIDEMMQTQQELQNNKAMLSAALNSAKVMEWKYDFKRKVITDSGSFGVNFHMPKVIEHVP